ncbi:MAG: hypothetical protein HC817_03640 [Saprospiraceae bacterium]|nr:hypothetical protein [Saprospiraceae bacterium]
MVYYWRVSADSIKSVGFSWQSASFVYLSKATQEGGWNQSHYFQFLKNNLNGLVRNPQTRDLNFTNGEISIEIKNVFNSPSTHPNFFIDNEYAGRYYGAPESGIYVMFFDSLRGIPSRNIPSGNPPFSDPNGLSLVGRGLRNPRNFYVVQYLFDMATDDPITGRKGLIDFLNNDIKPNQFVVINTVQLSANSNFNAETWAADSLKYGTNIFQVLEKQGANRFRELATKGTLPYLFAYQKDRSNPIIEKLAERYEDGVASTFQIPTRGFLGQQTTALIGPAREWQRIEHTVSSQNFSSNDTITFDIVGIDKNQKEVTLFSKINLTIFDIAGIEATQYPYIKLIFNVKDSLSRTAAQLKSWRVLYEGYPDFALNMNSSSQTQKDSLEQGEPFSFSTPIENVGHFDAKDSVWVKMDVRDAANKTIQVSTKVPPLSRETAATAKFDLSTAKMSGAQQVNLVVNPDGLQPEQVLFNNFLQKPLFVRKDAQNPLLDVTFDGVRIFDKDIVSAKPNIQITLKDENKYLTLADTSLFQISLTKLERNAQKKDIFFNNSDVRFLPAQSNQNNKATVEFRPTNLTDGEYRLEVQGRDASGNTATALNYSITFQIITRSSVSNVLPYPNPFSTSTRFAYTLTGATPPQYFKIQIMTVSGKIVREITHNEIGTLKIGKHLTDYTWDGTDEYGNKLANGVYLYRVVTKKENGESFERFDTEIDSFFKNDFGKIVIVR